MNCILCNTTLREPIHIEKEHRFFKCHQCGSVVRSTDTFPNYETEIDRYQTHNNDVNDPRYQKFVSPITLAVQADFSSQNTLGLDFGAGTGPVITKVLNDKGYKLNLYDPFFHPDKSVLEEKYDYIVSCEVIEHFHHPLKEFQLLKKLLKPNGKLYCMTDIYSDAIDFGNWYYKNDPTHVIFYTEKSLHWILKEIGFNELTIDKRLIDFS